MKHDYMDLGEQDDEQVARMSAAICGDKPRMSLRSSGLRLLPTLCLSAHHSHARAVPRLFSLSALISSTERCPCDRNTRGRVGILIPE
jgi:hypothetical protein